MASSRRFIVPLLLAALFGLASPVAADMLKGQDEESRFLSDKFYFEIGWFGADVSTDISFGFGNNLGTFLRLENDLLLEDSSDSGLFMATWRFNRKNSLSFSTTQVNRKGQNLLSKEFEIGDPDDPDGLRFGVGALVDSEFDNEVYAFIYRFSFYNNGKIDAGIEAGVSFYDFSISLSGEAQIVDEDGNVVESTGFQRFTEDVLAPIPTFGIHLAYAINRKLIFRFNTNALNLDIGDYEGRISQVRTTIQWFFIRNLSIGGGLINNSIDIKDTSDSPWRVDYQYGGFNIFLGAAF